MYSSAGRRDDSPIDGDPRNEREGSRESDHDDRDRRRRGGGYERDLRRENRRYAPYPSADERSNSRRQSGSGGKECRVYVWNLPYSVKWQDLKDFMKKGNSAEGTNITCKKRKTTTTVHTCSCWLDATHLKRKLCQAVKQKKTYKNNASSTNPGSDWMVSISVTHLL